MVSTLEQMQVPNGTGPGVRRSKRDGKHVLIVVYHVLTKMTNGTSVHVA